jgi:hypothetical protein
MTSTRAMRRKRMSKRRQRGGGIWDTVTKALGFGSGNPGDNASTEKQNSNVSAETVAKQMNGENDQPTDKGPSPVNQEKDQEQQEQQEQHAEMPARPANPERGQNIPDTNGSEEGAPGFQGGGKRTRRSKKARCATQRRRRRASSRKAGKK